MSPPTYEILQTDDGEKAIKCRRCGEVSRDPQDVKLLTCPKCGYHSVYPPGMGGLLNEERLKTPGGGKS